MPPGVAVFVPAVAPPVVDPKQKVKLYEAHKVVSVGLLVESQSPPPDNKDVYT